MSTIKEWIPFFQNIMLTIYGFYFGSRGIEKWQRIRSESSAQTTTNVNTFSQNQEPKG
ncbi:MAG: hypothetical protein HRU38_07630 [Saccharospirillaceae bacterium]|nr:hypothetical protein [Pseudomonadales bacterium]NRB78523.1 hypothetical protein [Saccharospirillaceae bacterium]